MLSNIELGDRAGNLAILAIVASRKDIASTLFRFRSIALRGGDLMGYTAEYLSRELDEFRDAWVRWATPLDGPVPVDRTT